jgi:putative oxidoreductase
MPDLKLLSERESTSIDITGWCLRIGVAGFFVLVGLEKFPSGPGAPWVALFDRIGLGQWFRVFTGVVEVAGGLLFASPRTTRVGAALLACAMVGAILVHVFVFKRPGNAVIPAAALAAVLIVGFRRRE